MKKIIAITLMIFLFLPSMVLAASNIDFAKWYGLITISNNSTAVTEVATTANISTPNLIADNYLNASANNCAMLSSSGVDVAFQPGYTNANLWSMWVPSIGADSYLTYILYTAESSGGELRYFPGAGGMTTTDNASLELGDNFTIEQKGWVDTAYSANKSLVDKPNAFRTYINKTGYVISGIAIPNGVNLDFVQGNGDWVRVPDHADFSFTDGVGNDKPFTLIGWANFDDSTSQAIITKGQGATNEREWEFRTSAADKLLLKCIKNDDAGVSLSQEITAAITGYENTWIHIAATYDGSETAAGIKLYINGSPEAMTDVSAGAYAGMTDGTGVVEIGSQNGGLALYMDGGLAEIKVYSAELSPAQILDDFNEVHETANLVAYWKIDEGVGLPQDSSGNGHHANQNLADWDTDFQRWINVTATGITSSNLTVTTNTSALTWASGDTIQFDGSADSGIDCTAAYADVDKFWASLWFRLDVGWAAGSGQKYLSGQYRDGNEYFWLALTNDGTLHFKLSDTNLAFDIASAETSWAGGQWYHVLFSTSNATGQRLRIDNGTVVTSANLTTDLLHGVPLMIGQYRPNNASGITGTIANYICGIDDLSPAEETTLYNGIAPADATDLWYIDEGFGTNIVSYGTLATAGTADTNCTWAYTTRPCKFTISIDGTAEDGFARPISVPPNSANWTFVENYSMMYLEYQEISVNSTLQQDIEWRYGDVFYDSSHYGMEFDGDSGFVTVADDAAIQNIFDGGGTVECWINADSDGEGNEGRIFDKVKPLSYISNEVGGEVKIRFIQLFSGVNGMWYSTSAEIDINTWTHVVITYDNSATTNDPIIYVNGSSVTLTESTTPTGTRDTDVGSDLIIGNRFTDDRTFDGTIDEVRLYTRIMGQTEVTANYNNGVGSYTPDDTSNLDGWWHIENGIGTTVTDYSGNGNTGTITGAKWVNGHIPLPPTETGTNPATPTFRSASSDPDVSANMTAFLPIAEAKAPDYVLGVAPAFFTATPNITGNFTIIPPTGGFPLAGVIADIANATNTPPQLPLLIIAVFTILAASLSMSALMRKSGSGTLIVKIIVITAFLGIFIALKNFGIDFWMLIVFLIIAVALAMGSRQLGWQ